MKAWLFYPLMAALVAGLVAFAWTRGERAIPLTVEQVRAQGYVLEGEDLAYLTASPGTEVVVGEGLARARMVDDRASSPPSAGVFATLIPVHEAAFGGREIEVEWRLRRPDGPGRVEVGYFTIGAGDSGWREVEVDEAWTDASFRFAPRAPVEEGFDYVGLWPGVGEPDGSAIEIERVTVRLAR